MSRQHLAEKSVNAHGGCSPGEQGSAGPIAGGSALAGARTLGLVQGGAGSADALAAGYHLAWLVGAATVLVSAGVVITVLRKGPSVPAAAELLEEAAAA